MEVIQREEIPGAAVEVVQYPELQGSSDVRTAERLYYARQAGMRLKFVRITLQESAVRVEPATLYFMKGRLELKSSTGGGLVKALKRRITSGEPLLVNEIHGSGEVWLEPTFGHFFLHKLSEDDEGVIVDRKMFYAGTGGLDVTSRAQKRVAAAAFGGEGLFQTSIQGTGIAVLYSPVPASEVLRYELSGDKLWVDGPFAIMRSAGVEFRVEKSSKSLLSTGLSGEGLLQTFEGDGSVWIAPTQAVYERLLADESVFRRAAPPPQTPPPQTEPTEN